MKHCLLLALALPLAQLAAQHDVESHARAARQALAKTAQAASSQDAPSTAERPNIIYVMLDDAGWGDFGANGSKHVKTPVFDRMCKEGMRFDNHYSGSAVCAPTRCVLLTGLHSGHCRRRDNTATGALDEFKKQKRRPLVFLEDHDVTIAEALKTAGYVTGGVGKWGIGNPGTAGSPDKQGFDHFYGYLDQVHAHNHYSDWLWRNGKRVELPKNKGGKRGTYIPDLLEEDSLRFIRDNAKKPFFLYCCWTLPHGKYDIPDASEYADKPWPQKVKNFAAMITRADKGVGKILALLKELGIDDKTILFYTSDNGPNRPFVKPLGSAGPFRGTKRQLTEGGLRAPMAVRWPGKVPAGQLSHYVWSMIDVFPTLCELAGAKLPSKLAPDAPEQLDGKSVVATLLGKKQAPLPFVYWEIHHPFHQAVRKDKYKAIRFGTKEKLQLYDVDNDPAERKDIAAEHPDLVKELGAIMDREHTPSRYYPAREKRRRGRRQGRRRREN